MKLPIPLMKPKLIDPDKLKEHYINICASGHYTNFGPYYNKALTKLSQIYVNKDFVICNNGTTSLQAILQMLPKGSRVAVPSFTFIATFNAVIAAGHIPVILPSNIRTWCISKPDLIRNFEKYDAFVSVSPFGYNVDFKIYDIISRCLEKPVIYDCAAGWGQQFDSTINPISVSLHATKSLPIGEGGLVILDKASPIGLKSDIKELINFGLNDKKEITCLDGFNGKLDELHCAILYEQLKGWDWTFAHGDTLDLMKKYQRDLSQYDLQLPKDRIDTPQLPVFKVGKDFDKLQQVAAAHNIILRRYYWPLLNLEFPNYCIEGANYNDEYFGSFIALPKDINEEEYQYIIRSLTCE